jgi:glutamate--cysteine ligase
MQGIAEVFDQGDPARPYRDALAVQAAKVDDITLTPSARMLAELESTGESFFDLALRMSRLHKEYFLALYPPNVERQAEFRSAAEESLRAQAAVEAADRISFEQYLANYAAP